MKAFIFILMGLLSSQAFAASETIPVFGHLVFFHCDTNKAPGCASDPDRVQKAKLTLTSDQKGLLQGSQIFSRSVDGFDFKVTVTAYKLSSGDYFFRADLAYGRPGSPLHTRRLGNTFVSRVRSLGQIYWNGEMVGESASPLSVDFGFGYDSDLPAN